MTCVAGFVEGRTVWMGTDSAGIAGYDLTVRADAKVFRNGPMLFGFTSSFRMGQLLQYALKVPDRDPCVSIEQYLSSVFIDAVRECLKTHGFATKLNDVETGGTFLVGYKGRLFQVSDDYQVGEAANKIDAVGCAYQIARGAMYASTAKGRARVLIALKAAEVFSASVRGPFHVLSLSGGSDA